MPELEVSKLLDMAQPWNPRTMSERDLESLRDSLREFGAVQSIVVNSRSGRIVGGHQRVQAAQAEGITMLPVTYVDLDEKREQQLNLALNRIGGAFDEKMLQDLFRGLDEEEARLTGFDEEEIKRLLGDQLVPMATLEWVAIELLRPHPRNYRRHPEEQIEHLKHSIKRLGFYRNLLVTKCNTILAGHGIAEAARALGVVSVPVIRVNVEPDDIRALKIMAADNEVSRLCETDDRSLTEILKELKNVDLDGLAGTGFDEQMLANLVFVTRPQSEIRDSNAAGEWVGMPEYSDEHNRALQVIVNFRTREDRDAFSTLIGIEFGEEGRARSIWFPEKERDDRSSVMFKSR